MAEKDTRSDEIKVSMVGGLDERTSKDNQGPSSFDKWEGVFPAQTGLAQRLPGKTLLTTIDGEAIRRIFQPFDGADTVLVTTDTKLYQFTLDEIMDRVFDTTIVPFTINEEETMAYALLAQIEANGTDGGSLKGFSSGSPDEVTQTFYRRKLTHKLTDADNFVTFAASTGSATTGYQTAGTFALATGTYRITAWLTYSNTATSGGLAAGLYNETDAAFEVHNGGTEPLMGCMARGDSTNNNNLRIVIEGEFVVSGGSKTFTIKHEASSQAIARALTACGFDEECTTNSNVNGAKSRQTFALIKLLQVS